MGFTAAMCGEPLGDDLAMPVGNRHLFRMLREMVPERLDVFEFLLRRKLVKARRWNGRQCHVSKYTVVPAM